MNHDELRQGFVFQLNRHATSTRKPNEGFTKVSDN